MRLFPKNAATIDEDLSALIHPSNTQARKQFAQVQEIVRQGLGGAEELRLIGVDLDQWGHPVTVVTNKRLMKCRRERIESHAPLPIADLELVSLAGPWWGVKGKPNLDVHFDNFQDANTFLVVLDPRDIPPLYPAFFERILRATDLPGTPTNMGRLTERVARMIMAGGAYAYFDQAHDESARRSFAAEFQVDLPPQAALSVCDEMINWLWTWHWTCHQSLRVIVPRIEELLLSEDSPLRKAKEEIPPMEW